MSTNVNDYVRVREGNVTWEVAEDTATPSFTVAGCPEDTLTINDGMASETDTIENWCMAQALTAAIEQIQLGNRTVTIDVDIALIPSDANFAQLSEWYKTRTPFQTRLTYSDNATTATTVTDTYRVVLTEFPRTFPLDGVATVGISMHVQEILTDMEVD